MDHKLKPATEIALIVDSALMLRAGHPYNAALSIADMAKEAGIQPVVLMNWHADSEGLSTKSWIPVFRKNCFGRIKWSASEFEELRLHYRKVIRDKAAHFKLPVSCVVMPTADSALLAAVYDLIEDQILSQHLRIAAWLLFPPDWTGDDQSHEGAIQVEENKQAIKNLSGALHDKQTIKLFCETDHLTSRYSKISDVPVTTAACPNALPAFTKGQQSLDGGNTEIPHLVMMGHASINKGYELLKDAILQVQASGLNPRFTVHGVAEYSGNPEVSNILKELSACSEDVTVISDALESEHYYRILQSADIVLLPYKLDAYSERGSGIFNEATRLGIPMIAPANAQFAMNAVQQARVVPMTAYDSSSLATAIRAAVSKIDSLKENALQHSQRSSSASCDASPLRELFISASNLDSNILMTKQFMVRRYVERIKSLLSNFWGIRNER